MSDPVRWGVLGNANIARVCVIPAIQKSRNGRVRALATRSPERSREVAEEHGIPKVHHGYEALLKNPEIEAVYVPLPNHLHHPWTLRALEAGKHVLCEKPLARNAAEAEEMSGAAEASGRTLMEAFMYRFHPRSLRIKRLLERGRIGELRLLHSSFCFRMQDEVLEAACEPRLRPELGGGALLDVGCYGVSVSRWLVGREPTAVQARAVYHPGGVDLLFVGTLQFPSDVLATVEAAFITALRQTYAVVGTRGAIELPHDAFIPWERDAVFSLRGVEEEDGEEHVTPGEDEYRLMVEHFSDVVRGVAQPACPPADSVANMRVLDALAESALTGLPVALG
jgi:predicted dehydrogenase